MVSVCIAMMMTEEKREKKVDAIKDDNNQNIASPR